MLDPRHALLIEYCVPWSYDERAVGLAAEVSGAYAPIMSEIRLVPSSKGRFEVSLDGELLFSKAELGRHAEPGEVMGLIAQRVGERIPR